MKSLMIQVNKRPALNSHESITWLGKNVVEIIFVFYKMALNNAKFYSNKCKSDPDFLQM